MAEEMNRGLQSLLESWQSELDVKLERAANLLAGAHLGSEGGFRESLLRGFLRSVLPANLRVSTGFVFWTAGEVSRQIDVLVWEAASSVAYLEEGEFAIVPPSSVVAVLEVKTTLTKKALRTALQQVSHPRWVHFDGDLGRIQDFVFPSQDTRHAAPPYRAVVAFRSGHRRKRNAVRVAFETVVEHYRQEYKCDARALLSENAGGMRWPNIVDEISVVGSHALIQGSAGVANDEQPCYRAYQANGELQVAELAMRVVDHWKGRTSGRETLEGVVRRSGGHVWLDPAVGMFTSAEPDFYPVGLGASAIWHPREPLW